MNIALSKQNSGHIYTLAYAKEDDTTTKQFLFHLFLVKKFSQQYYFPYKISCLTDETLNYLVFDSYAPRSPEYPRKIGETPLEGALIQDTREVLSIFMWLERNGAVFQDILPNAFMIIEYRRISFSPLSLLYVCQAGQPCYVQTEYVAAKKILAVKSLPLEKGPFDQNYVMITARKTFNRIHFLKLLKEYISQHMKMCQRPFAETLNKLFLEKTQFLQELLRDFPKIACSWNDLEEYIENYGKKGNVVELIKKNKEKQRRMGKRSSSISFEDAMNAAWQEEIELDRRNFS